MKKLVQGLLKIRVRPYYLFQCDLAQGIGHFRTSVSKGIQIMEMLRGHTSGLGIPTFVIDAPNGGGKIPILPNYLISQSDKEVIVRNYEGFITSYTEPEDKTSKCPPNCTVCNNVNKSTEGVAKLFNNEARVIIPKGTLREKRRQAIKKQKAISLGAIEPSISLME
jgi:lysine 2,3-aminomutase